MKKVGEKLKKKKNLQRTSGLNLELNSKGILMSSSFGADKIEWSGGGRGMG